MQITYMASLFDGWREPFSPNSPKTYLLRELPSELDRYVVDVIHSVHVGGVERGDMSDGAYHTSGKSGACYRPIDFSGWMDRVRRLAALEWPSGGCLAVPAIDSMLWQRWFRKGHGPATALRMGRRLVELVEAEREAASRDRIARETAEAAAAGLELQGPQNNSWLRMCMDRAR